ncbi:unnamed protein product [Protopolystoma xenopodis]|uniref:Uncharacterized protein n=1 Tax=Protopolystoma xenopodis TaxID=117903 RepID=A0A3S5BV79_9PLAT|nr:unnamed protein product [Protopolystoma xenopodis]
MYQLHDLEVEIAMTTMPGDCCHDNRTELGWRSFASLPSGRGDRTVQQAGAFDMCRIVSDRAARLSTPPIELSPADMSPLEKITQTHSAFQPPRLAGPSSTPLRVGTASQSPPSLPRSLEPGINSDCPATRRVHFLLSHSPSPRFLPTFAPRQPTSENVSDSIVLLHTHTHTHTNTHTCIDEVSQGPVFLARLSNFNLEKTFERAAALKGLLKRPGQCAPPPSFVPSAAIRAQSPTWKVTFFGLSAQPYRLKQ